MKVLVTGAAGFIGFHLAVRLLERGDEVVGLDNVNDYYDVNLKHGRLAETGIQPRDIEAGLPLTSRTLANYRFIKLDLADTDAITKLFEEERFDAACNLAAQAGVRYSLNNPHAYVQSNMVGFLNLLEGCRNTQVENVCYASSSSVYGLNECYPFSTEHSVDHPISLYAASKKANELMAHAYSHLYGLRTTGLRFFTVYGPWGRPDMAYFIFASKITKDEPIDVYNEGRMSRDFTYIDDIIEGIVRVVDNPAVPMPGWSGENPVPGASTAPWRVYNIGRGNPVNLLEFIETLEDCLGRKAVKNMLPMQPGDVAATWADVSQLKRDFGYEPRVTIQEGLRRFADWYQSHYVAGASADGLRGQR
jgi:UDP-glucuronate 4-epimerase